MSKEIKSKERKVFLENLPIYEEGQYKGKINWNKSIGHVVKFIYDDLAGEFEILAYGLEKKNYLTVKYNDIVCRKPICVHSFKKCAIGELIGVKTREFKIEIGSVLKDDKRNLTIIDRKHIYRESNNQYTKHYQYKCNKCGNEDWTLESGLLKRKIGCNVCGVNPSKITEYNCLATRRPDLMKYLTDKNDAYKCTPCCSKYINTTCPDCGLENRQKINNMHYRGFSCSYCGDKRKYPEKFMCFLLKELGVKFIKEYSPEYLMRKEGEVVSRKFSDFYLINYNIIIETDGALGHEGGKLHNKQKRTLEELIVIDKWKDEQHALHGIKTIRINCFESNMEYIRESILNSELINILDLSSINWKKIDNISQKNTIKEVCNKWNNGIVDTTILSNMFDISRVTVNNYLKMGNELGWCSYDPVDEQIKGRNRYASKVCTPFEMFDINNNSLGIYKSFKGFERESELLVGFKINSGRICEVCKGLKSHHKGYTFRYITKEEYEQRKSQQTA